MLGQPIGSTWKLEPQNFAVKQPSYLTQHSNETEKNPLLKDSISMASKRVNGQTLSIANINFLARMKTKGSTQQYNG